ncbi:peptidoglycan-associated lipoprotein Pal [Sphingomonas sp. LHG3406-1]|uniref:peptidoglycan-associated lipoprotein Pal n=1 Tax=Sphingomonas sp. LHG3406-1 TaxID=2804617 RepID=UPI0026141EEE|nr:peptidoglycan-associated lipoprotein Pal [Sphingomonas sp. LHG3406-1]
MRRTLMIASLGLALTLNACGRKPPVETTPPVETGQTGATEGTVDSDEVGLVELPGSQAALVAAAGSDTIYFGTDQSDISADAQATLRAQAKWLVANPNVRASVEGHADERGTREYNQALGERRAQAAKLFLMAQGVPENQLLTISWGKERPVATGSDESAWAQNRRAVTVVVR